MTDQSQPAANPLYSPQWFDSLAPGANRSARVVLPLVLDLVTVRSAVDVGCGRGTWLTVLRELGVDDIIGIDGNWVDDLEIPRDRFGATDLSRPFRLDRRFDLAVSLEVAEHLPSGAADGFVQSLTALAPIVLFSAAIPFQPGSGHVNQQWPEYWAERFARHGYLPVDCIRPSVWRDPNVEFWYAQNTLLYVAEHRLRTDRGLQAAYAATHQNMLSLVHPALLARRVQGLAGRGGPLVAETTGGPSAG